ncbi:MAG: secretin N-terminal domain-containing protein [Planctomycetota bacterium]
MTLDCPVPPVHLRRARLGWRLLAGVAVLVAWGGATSSPSAAAEPELVGVLAAVVDPANAEQLAITAEQRSALLDVIDEREMQGLALVLTVKDLAREERLRRLAPYREETVRLGMEILSEDQQAKVAAMQAAATDPALRPSDSPNDKAASDEAGVPAEPTGPPAEADAPAKAPEAEPAATTPEASPPAPGAQPETPTTPGAAAETPARAAPSQSAPAAVPLAGLAPLPAAEPAAAIAAPPVDETPVAVGDEQLSFNFRYQPWREVLDWFAERADLSLVLESPPAGTFNYQDRRSYSIGEALDVLNSVLLTKGYTLVRKGRMLLLVNLEDGIPPNLVTDVPLSALDERGEYELVRVLFRVRNMLPADAAEELRQLMGPQGAILVLPKAGMIQVTETAGRIRTLRSVIDAIEQPGPAGGDLREFRLSYVVADEALPTLRQLLGIPADAMATPTGSLQLAADPLGAKLFAQGAAVQLRRLEEILKLVDVPEAALGEGLEESPQLEVYSIATIDPELVLSVLQTILGGNETTRLATDAQTGNLVALATPTEHATIRATLEQMQQDSRKIEVIPLTTVDPQLAVLSINKLFSVDAGDDGPSDPRAPIVDADLSTSSLIVRASSAQIEQIKDFLNQLGEGAAAQANAQRGNVRMLAIDPSEARSAMTQLEQLWPLVRPNRIRLLTPSRSGIPSFQPSGDGPGGESPTRDGAREPSSPANPLDELFRDDNLFGPGAWERRETTDRRASTSRNAQRRVPARFAAQIVAPPATGAATDSKAGDAAEPVSRPGAEILVVPGPTGTYIASEDLDALDAFEELLRSTVSQASLGGRQFAVYYLKYAEATSAAETLAKVFGASSGGGGGGGLMDGLADAALGGLGGGLMGDLLGLGGGGGGGGFSSAAVDIVPDVRLNALVVYAQATDLDTIDQLLRVLDQRTGPEPVEAGGKPRMIPVVNTSAAEVADVVRQVFADRIQGSGSGGGQQPSPQDLIRALRRGAGGGGGGSNDQEPTKMTLGVDTRSNSIVVRAPDPLFEQVRQLVEQLDEEGVGPAQATRIVSLKHTNSTALRDTLASLLGEDAVTTSSGATNQSGNSSRREASSRNNSRRDNNGDATRETMQRIEMFRRMRDMQQQMQGGGRGGQSGEGRGRRGGGSRGGGRGR